MKKILVIRFSSFGDIILSFPLIKILKEKFPLSQIHFLTKEKYLEIVSMNPDINRVMLFDGSLTEMRKNISKEKFDLIIDIHKNFRSIAVSFLNGKKIERYRKENFKKFMLVKFKINLFEKIIPVFEKYLLTIKDYIKLEGYQFTKTDLDFDKSKTFEDSYVVISPASRHFTKTYPAEKFIDYINSNGEKKYVLIGDNSDNDRSICELISSRCQNVVNLCGKLSIKELAGLIYNCEYVICNDSAILHLSEALGKKVYAIFGSTVREFGFFPQLKESKVFEVSGLKCRPCTHIGLNACPKGHFKCMRELQLTVSS